MGILKTILPSVRAFLLTRAAVTAENLALCQQLAVVAQSVKRPKRRPRDRVFWGWVPFARRFPALSPMSGASSLTGCSFRAFRILSVHLPRHAPFLRMRSLGRTGVSGFAVVSVQKSPFLGRHSA